jgi:hypothetical protein
MHWILKWSRPLLVLLGLAGSVGLAFAQTRSTSTTGQRPGATAPVPMDDSGPAGNPQMGLLIIAGIIGFLILVAWLLTRVSEEGRQGDDRSLLG